VNPLTRGLPPPDPRSLCSLSSNEIVELPTPKKFLGTPLMLAAQICEIYVIHYFTQIAAQLTDVVSFLSDLYEAQL
jgi:hypothetical protein